MLFLKLDNVFKEIFLIIFDFSLLLVKLIYS